MTVEGCVADGFGHLGHHVAKANPHYFESDQFYHLTTDPAGKYNLFDRCPDVAEQMKQELSAALKQFEGMPFGEFAD